MWFAKVIKRRGLSTPIWERFGIYCNPIEFTPSGAVYIHAVSVGESLIALKFINTWLEIEEERHFLLAVSTTTSWSLLKSRLPQNVELIYAPFDSRGALSRMFKRFEPSCIILIESEIWPNLILQANKRKIPLCLLNAKLSRRSEQRHQKIKQLSHYLFSSFKIIGVQTAADIQRFRELGAKKEAIFLSGSIKFDSEAIVETAIPPEFEEQLASLGKGPIILLASTFPNEEEELCRALALKIPEARLVVVPRHEERREEVKEALAKEGFEPILRTQFHPPSLSKKPVFIVDTTGELALWTKLAQIVIIGKSLKARGGQNPVEAIQASIPVVTGPYMNNFQPLVSQLVKLGGIAIGINGTEIAEKAHQLLETPNKSNVTKAALTALTEHKCSSERSVKKVSKEIFSKII